jgi:hypothetical protein
MVLLSGPEFSVFTEVQNINEFERLVDGLFVKPKVYIGKTNNLEIDFVAQNPKGEPEMNFNGIRKFSQ